MSHGGNYPRCSRSHASTFTGFKAGKSAPVRSLVNSKDVFSVSCSAVMAPEIQTTVMLTNIQSHHPVSLPMGKIFHSQVSSPLWLLYMILWLRYYTDTSGVHSQPNPIHTATADSLHRAEVTELPVSPERSMTILFPLVSLLAIRN